MSHVSSLSLKGLTTLITGPTSGIGRDLAELFAQQGSNLILVSRNLHRLDELKKHVEKKYNINAWIFSKDLARSGSAAELISLIRNAGLRVDVLVNNAGYGVFGYFIQENVDDQVGMIELHIATPTRLSHAFLPGMIERRTGGILNIASTAAFQPIPTETVYAAVKSYLLNFTEGLREEVQSNDVRITCFCPGPTQTEFFDQPTMKNRGPARLTRMKSDQVAKEAYEAFLRGDVIGIPGVRNQLMVLASKLAPRTLVRKAARKVVESWKSNP